MSAPTQASKASQHPPLRQVGQSTAQPVPQDPNQFKIPEIPERTLLALTPSNLRKLQQARGRCAKASSQMPAKTTDSLESNASGFLEAKIEQLTEFRDYLELVKCGILEGNDQQPLSNEELQSHMAPVVTKLATTTATLQVLKSQKRHLAHDLEEETTAFRRQKTGRELQDLTERAYVQAIIDRVMRATAKQAATPFKAKRFKEDVNEIYGIIDRRPIRAYNWCHVLGIWRDAVMIKAARIVPKSLNIGELGHIFGDSNDVISDPLNVQFHLFLAAKVSYSHVVRLLAISLHKNIERHLDQGTIVIVPAPGDFTVPTKWRCLVLDRSKGMDIICLRTDVKDMDRTSGRGDQFVRVKDLHDLPLMFLNDNRPRRRYLYLRFIISYLNAKRQNMADLSVPLETKQFWPSPGGYLHETTLKIMARSVSGCELPPPLVSGQTFEPSDNPSQDNDAGNTLAAAIIKPALFSTRASGKPSSKLRKLLLETLHFSNHETDPEEELEDADV